ncbi:UvrD-helicase domain-containing protein [Rhabdothermincola salaria]|uniref:ATP-dependent DNA helicase UvrD2 n=1 Tax=Rhabdothermincola salaria TaxID=2903142 RepID=UPI001E53BDE5|nr:ATP-dependent DNA helicase UvrD2 [Rhabdothermincola salaria]
MDPDALLEGLNDAQRAAVTSEAAPLCILAGAGSGKTRVLTRRVAWRAATGDLDPRHVLTLTFTRKAAGELTARLRALGLRDNVAAGTFHGIAYAQLRSRWADRGIEPPTLLERKVGFVARLLPPGRQQVPAIDLVAEIEWAKARMVAPDRYAEAAERASRRPPIPGDEVARIFAAYEDARRRQRMVDFDDLLRLCARDLDRDPDFAAAQRWRFQHLFVDEFQDVNPLQQALLDAWLGDRLDLCVVGDPNQAIYAWNGADAQLLRLFPKRYPTAEVVRLTTNYRSSPQVLAVANAVLAGGGRGVDRDGALVATRPEGPVPTVTAHDDDRAEARGIARAVRDQHRPGSPWSAQAVLVRTNAQITLLEEALHEVGIPFRVRGGAALLDQPEVKAALRTVQRATGGFPEALADLEAAVADPDGTEGDRAEERRANLEALVRLAHDYTAVEPVPSVPGFLTWLRATTRADQPDRHGDAVEIATFHAAKGLEWPVVHLAGLEQGLVPIGHARTGEALAEELRLFYVALTRAERELCLTWAAERTFGTRAMKRDRSPYLETVVAACAALRSGADPAQVGQGGAPLGGAAPGRARAARPSAARSRSRPNLPRTRGAPAPDDLDDDARALFEALRDWRAGKARAAAMPPYVICNDRTLLELATRRPRTTTALLAVHGLGEVKVGRFGDELLDLVADHAP